MKTEILEYYLPKELIAQEPVEPRDHSRLMIVSRSDSSISHDYFYNLSNYIKDSVIVFNDSRVFPARIEFVFETGGKAEILLVRKIFPESWLCFVKPAKKFRVGRVLKICPDIFATVKSYVSPGQREIIITDSSGAVLSDESVKRLGKLPVPPYIKKYPEDPERYQTVYAKEEGSIAAPTAGLHFTPELIRRLEDSRNTVVHITLHVGAFTIRPIQTENIENHTVSEEEYEISEYEAELINRAFEKGRRVVAVGTTVVRALESSYENGRIEPGRRKTDLFIYPGYEFKAVDSLITNFHLPRTSLLALVYAFAGVDLGRSAYEIAVRERYRFYSFGDAMLIL